MAIIYSYPQIEEVSGSDLLLISDDSKANRTFSSSVTQLSDYVTDQVLNGTRTISGTNFIANSASNSVPGIVLQGTENGAFIKFNNNNVAGTEDAFIQTSGYHFSVGGTKGYSTSNINIDLTNGFVGIKQKTPLAPLHIKGSIFVDSPSGVFFRTAAGAARTNIQSGDNAFLDLNTLSTGKIRMNVGGSEALRVQLTGSTAQVVIGNPTSVPSTRELYVDGGIETTQGSFFTDISASGRVDADSYKLKGLNTPPASSTDTGVNGEIRVTSDYIYVCIQNNVWKRVALSTWT